MISLQWQDGVLSLLDQAAYPQQEHWITCSTVEETAQALSSGAILEEKIAAVAGVYGYCLAAMAHQELQQTPQFQEKLDQAKALAGLTGEPDLIRGPKKTEGFVLKLADRLLGGALGEAGVFLGQGAPLGPRWLFLAD